MISKVEWLFVQVDGPRPNIVGCSEGLPNAGPVVEFDVWIAFMGLHDLKWAETS